MVKTEMVVLEIRKLVDILDDNNLTQRSIKAVLFTLLGSLCHDSPPNHLYDLHTLCYNFSCQKVEELKTKVENKSKLLN